MINKSFYELSDEDIEYIARNHDCDPVDWIMWFMRESCSGTAHYEFLPRIYSFLLEQGFRNQDALLLINNKGDTFTFGADYIHWRGHLDQSSFEWSFFCNKDFLDLIVFFYSEPEFFLKILKRVELEIKIIKERENKND